MADSLHLDRYTFCRFTSPADENVSLPRLAMAFPVKSSNCVPVARTRSEFRDPVSNAECGEGRERRPVYSPPSRPFGSAFKLDALQMADSLPPRHLHSQYWGQSAAPATATATTSSVRHCSMLGPPAGSPRSPATPVGALGVPRGVRGGVRGCVPVPRPREPETQGSPGHRGPSAPRLCSRSSRPWLRPAACRGGRAHGVHVHAGGTCTTCSRAPGRGRRRDITPTWSPATATRRRHNRY